MRPQQKVRFFPGYSCQSLTKKCPEIQLLLNSETEMFSTTLFRILQILLPSLTPQENDYNPITDTDNMKKQTQNVILFPFWG